MILLQRLRRSKALAAAAAMGLGLGFFSANSFARQSIERNLKVTGAVELEVRTSSEDLKVQAGEAGSVAVTCIVRPQNNSDEGREELEKTAQFLESHLPLRQEGNHISIEPLQDREMLRHANIIYEITVPADSSLTFETSAGDLSVEGLRGSVEFRSSSGDMRLKSVEGSVRAHTSSGDVSLEDMGKGAIEVETQSGDVTIQLASQVGYDLSAHTSSGDFAIGPELTLEAGDTKHEVRGKVRGGGTRLQVQTASGDIRVD
jgi:hypothetical protein